MTHHIALATGLGSSFIARFTKWSKELEPLLDDLPNGIDAVHYNWTEWRQFVRNVIRDKNRGKVIMVVHSNGAYFGAKAAQDLSKHRIKVDYLAVMDPTLKPFPKLGGNVIMADEFRASRGFVALGRRISCKRLATLKAGREFRGTLNVQTIRGGHTEIASNPIVRRHIVETINGILE